ncbi:hypothetical protein NEMBOFW57_004481 [Staphylotrichum longicolle]|uniref:Uncharacterized protein n=1 Tax=Staphylotrichum longicolle TaxID=669026 RepID=A0AAD4F860_9PEZI|nr:hypothetical protein NEMBOFW57_004481 [Staphylotrichum longicolle]
MGVELSLLFNNGKKSKKKSGRGKATSGDSSGVKIDIGVVNFVEGFRIFTEGIRNLGEAYTTVENGRVHRAEMQRNGQAMRNVIPEVKALVSNLATYVKHRNIHELFLTFLQGANTVAYWVDVLQGDKAQAEIGKLIHGELEAHVGLEAPRKFARQVHMTIKEQMASTPAGDAHDIFFLYHPDTNWHGEFLHIVKRHPLPANFLGMSENLDAIVIWMLFLRRQLGDKLKKARFHLVIPAYRPMLVKDPLIFPEALYPLTIRGLVHNSKPLVWFGLPTIDGVPLHLLELHHIGNLSRPAPGVCRLLELQQQ